MIKPDTNFQKLKHKFINLKSYNRTSMEIWATFSLRLRAQGEYSL